MRRLVRFIPVSCALLLFAVALPSQTPPAASQPAPTQPGAFSVGERAIVLPSPSAALVEAGSNGRASLDYLVPQTNRMVAAFVTPADLAYLVASQLRALSVYAVVEVPRSAEFTDATAADFASVVRVMNQQFGDIIQGAVKDQQDEINQRLKAYNANAATITLDKPVQLGNWFTKTDAVGYGILMPVSAAGKTTNMAGGIVVVRVNERLLFAYYYAVVKDAATLPSVRSATEAWADSILAANRK
jgi:hypothetical protein